MGAGMVMKVLGKDGKEKYVRLTGAEKANIYRLLANFGIYEQDIDPKELPEEERLNVAIASRPDERAGVKFDRSMYPGEDDHIKASTMHCCEAAEIVFEDIT